MKHFRNLMLLLVITVISILPVMSQEEQKEFKWPESVINSGIFSIILSQRDKEDTEIYGTWGLTFNDYDGSTRYIKKYKSISDGFFIEQLNYRKELDSEGDKYLFFNMRSLDRDDIHLGAEVQKLASYDFSFKISRMPYRLEHITRDYINDLNPQDIYYNQNTAVLAQGKYDITPHITVRGGFHQENLSGTCQLLNVNFNERTNGSCIGCHTVNSQTKQVQQFTRNFDIGATVSYSPFIVEYRRTESRFVNEAPVPSFDYGQGAGRLSLDVLPNISFSGDTLRTTVIPYNNAWLDLSYANTRRVNLRTDARLDSQKFKASFASKVNNRLYVSTHYTFAKDQNSILASLSRQQHNFRLNSTVNFGKGFSMIVGYQRLTIDRNSGGFSYDSKENIYNLKFRARPAKNVRFTFDFSDRTVDNPFYANQPTDEQTYRFMGSWQPLEELSLACNYNRMDIKNLKTDYSRINQLGSISLIAHPAKDFTLNFTWGSQKIESSADLLYGFQAEGQLFQAYDLGTPFFIKSNYLDLGLSYRINEKFRILGNLKYAHSEGETNFISYPQLSNYSAIDIDYWDQSYGVGYTLSDNLEMTFTFRREKYTDRFVPNNSGSDNSFMLDFSTGF